MEVDDEKQAEMEPDAQPDEEETELEEEQIEPAIVENENEPAVIQEEDDILEEPTPSQAKNNEKEEEKNLPRQRLFIERITCENFKSYHGVKEIGPFHKVFFFKTKISNFFNLPLF